MQNLSIFMRIYYALVALKNDVLLAVLKMIMKAERAASDVRKAKETEEDEVSEERITAPDVFGYDAARKELQDAVQNFKNRDKSTAPACLLLYGPAGTDKSALMTYAADAAGVPLYSMNAASITGKDVIYDSAYVRFLFQQARENALGIVFIDNIDAIGKVSDGDNHGKYSGPINALIYELDGMENSCVLTVVATSRLSDLDPALLQRFSHKIEMPHKEN